MSSTSSKNISLRVSWIANSNLCAIHQSKAIHGISSFIIARTPLIFPELTVAPSAPGATIWFLNSGKPRKRVKTNYLSTKNYFQSRFYCQSKLSNQPHSQGLYSLFLSCQGKVPSSGRLYKASASPGNEVVIHFYSHPQCYSFFYKKIISNRKKTEKNSCVD